MNIYPHRPPPCDFLQPSSPLAGEEMKVRGIPHPTARHIFTFGNRPLALVRHCEKRSDVAISCSAKYTPYQSSAGC